MIKTKHPKDPFSYLWFIGVNPQRQNKGIGSAFIQDVVAECERCIFRTKLYHRSAANLTTYSGAKFTSIPGQTLPVIPLESLPDIPGKIFSDEEIWIKIG